MRRRTPSCRRRATAVLQDVPDVYTTASPCWPCFKQIANSGVRRIVYGEFYRDERIFQVAQKLGIELVDLSGQQP